MYSYKTILIYNKILLTKLISHINNLFKNLEINKRAPEQGLRRKARVNVPCAVFTRKPSARPCLMILMSDTNLIS